MTKTIQVSDETWKKLQTIKINSKKFESLDAVIQYLLKEIKR